MEFLNKERLLFIALAFFAAALGVRWIAIMQNYVVANDATLYIKSAKLYSMGAYAEGFNAFPRSTFPLFIAFVQRFVGNWVMAGQWVSAFFGALAVIPLYFLARRIFSEKIAMVSAIFYIVCPSLVKNSAEVLRDAPFIFFYITALWLGYAGIRDKRAGVIGLAGVFILLSASLKDYGLMLFVSLLLFLAWFIIKRQITVGKSLIFCFTFLLSAIVVLIPLGIGLDYKRFNMHAPIVSRAKSALTGITHQRAAMLELENEIERLEISTQGKRLFGLAIDHHFALYFFNIVSKTVHAFNIIFFVLFIFGLMKRYIVPYRFDEFLLLTIYVAYIPLFFLLLNFATYLQTKNVFPILVPSLIWSSVGFEEFIERAILWIKERDFALREKALRWVTPLLLLVICIPLLSMAWAPHRKDKLELREIGLWLKNNGYAYSTIVAQGELSRLVFYSDGAFVPLPGGTYQDIIRFAREKRASLLVISRKNIDHISPHFLDMASPSDLQPINIPGIKTPKYATMVFRVKGLRENK